MSNKVFFKNLSWPLKAAVIMAWIIAIIEVLAFLVGFIDGLLYVI